MPSLDRRVAAITCREVLDDLSSYLDGELLPARAAQVEAHLRGCRECERFGGRVGGIVSALRRALVTPAPLPPAAAGRLGDRLRAAQRSQRDGIP